MTPAVILLAALALGWAVMRVAAAWAAESSSTARFFRTWGLATIALVSLYSAQELLEGVLASGHPAGLAVSSAMAAGSRFPRPPASRRGDDLRRALDRRGLARRRALAAGPVRPARPRSRDGLELASTVGLLAGLALIAALYRLGIAGMRVGVDYTLLSARAIWTVQVLALVAGHIGGLMLAHDSALVDAAAPEDAARSQRWMLAVMVAFTSLALWLISSANG